MNNTWHFLDNSLSNSLRCNLWHIDGISFEIPYHMHWNMTYGWQRAFPLHFLIKFIEIWSMNNMWRFPLQFHIRFTEISSMTSRCHFLYKSLSYVFKHDVSDRSYFLYTSLSNSSKYGIWTTCFIFFTIPFKIEIWPLTRRYNFLRNSFQI